MHQACQVFFEKYNFPTVKSSMLFGIPLLIQKPQSDCFRSELETLPETYRGGIWVYAATSQDWTIEHERYLYKIARFTTLLYMEQYALEAMTKQEEMGEDNRSKMLGHDVLRAIHHHRPDIRLIVVTSQLLQRQHSNPQKGLLANFKWRLRQASGKGTNLLNKLFQVLIESSDPEKQFIETVASLRQPGVIGILNKQEIEQNADRAYDSILAQIRNFSSSDCGRED